MYVLNKIEMAYNEMFLGV